MGASVYIPHPRGFRQAQPAWEGSETYLLSATVEIKDGCLSEKTLAVWETPQLEKVLFLRLTNKQKLDHNHFDRVVVTIFENLSHLMRNVTQNSREAARELAYVAAANKYAPILCSHVFLRYKFDR